MKKKVLLVLFLLLSLVSVFVGAATLVPYETADGTNLKYRGTQQNVMIPDEYIKQDTDFRAVWISHLVSDFPSYSNETQYKNEVQKVFNVLEYFNINAMIFHVRTHNNALYKSELNPVASYYKNVNFDQFDPLEYIIEEAHKRGIEFHAWMNPYRLSTTFSGTPEQYAATQPSYNIASNPEMILKSGNSLILNPGEPAVREFLVDTVMELIENYDVDAIHFDDYFYINNVDDTHTRNKYNTEGLSLGDFRRKQIDLFIEDLYNTMRAYNLQNNRVVQLGISPSGIYRNGSHVPLENYKYDENGTLTYPLYSNSSGFAHYDNYLYSDTKKWIDEEWIDYIIPQTYWSFEQPVAGYAGLMDWWNMVVKYKNVNLYSGMGVYMANESSNTYGWKSNVDEAINQVVYSSNLEHVQGHSVYSYKHLRFAYDKNAGMPMLVNQLTKVKEEAWTEYTLLPEIRTYDPVVLPGVQNLRVEKVNSQNTVKFNALDGAKFYAIYRGENNVTFSTDELIAVVGANEAVISYTDTEVEGNYYYGVKAISNTNTLGTGTIATEGATFYTVDFYVDGKIVKSYRHDEEIILPEIPHKVGYDQVEPYWSITEFGEITENIRVDAIYTINKYTVNFMVDDEIFHSETVEHGQKVTLPESPTKEGYNFVYWDPSINLNSVTKDLEVEAIFSPKKVFVEFYGLNNELLKREIIDYGTDATAPEVNEDSDYVLIGWNGDFTNVTKDTIVYGIFVPRYYTVRFFDKDANLIEEVTVEYKNAADAPEAPKVDGYKFVEWDRDFSEIDSDLDVYAVYEKVKSPISCKDFGLSFFIFSLGLALFVFIRRKK